jgi:hypothetical protein
MTVFNDSNGRELLAKCPVRPQQVESTDEEEARPRQKELV